MKKASLKGVLGIILAGVVVYVYTAFRLYNYLPACPFKVYTGFDCPGCGSQRAVEALVHGNFIEAAHHNFLVVLSLPIAITNAALKRKVFWKSRVDYFFYKPALILIIAFWILRNIPLIPFSYLSS